MRKPFRGFLERYWKVRRRSAQGHGSYFPRCQQGRVRGADVGEPRGVPRARGGRDVWRRAPGPGWPRDAARCPLATAGRGGRARDGAGGVSRQPDRRRRFQQDGARPAAWPLASPAKGGTRKGRAALAAFAMAPAPLGLLARRGTAAWVIPSAGWVLGGEHQDGSWGEHPSHAGMPTTSSALGHQQHRDKTGTLSRDPGCPLASGTGRHFG